MIPRNSGINPAGSKQRVNGRKRASGKYDGPIFDNRGRLRLQFNEHHVPRRTPERGGANAPFWQYFGASLSHSVLALCSRRSCLATRIKPHRCDGICADTEGVEGNSKRLAEPWL
jgi:hypothetical protein